MVADCPTETGAKGGESAGGGGEVVRGCCHSQGAIKVLPSFEDGVAVGIEDCDRCLVKDNLAALVGKGSQTNEGMGKRWHDMAQHCCWGKLRNGR
jgi:hypothetical protein